MAAGPLEYGILAFTSLVAMTDPIAAAPMFLQLTSKRAEKRTKTAFRASLTAMIALLLFALTGTAIFGFFGITIPAFQIAGGLILVLSSLKALQGIPDHDGAGASEEADPAVVPIGIPLIAGAGSISTVMMLAGQAQGRLHQAALGGAIVGACVITLAVLLAAPKIVSRLGEAGTHIMTKVMGLLTAVIGVQFILNGVTAVVLDVMKEG
ncbi:MAG: MarC family protein [Fimbriimonadales bacterium]